jgi:hypothetical protein
MALKLAAWNAFPAGFSAANGHSEPLAAIRAAACAASAAEVAEGEMPKFSRP